MRYSTIVCLDDLVRADFWPAREFFYDLIRVPVFNASGVNIRQAPRPGQQHNLAPGFDLAAWQRLLGPRGAATPWQTLFHRWPDAAAQALCRHIPDGALVVGYEMPPALRSVLSNAGCDWVDLRLSPLRFASDLYVGIATNSPAVDAAAHAHAVRADEVMAEAALLAAQLRYPRRYDEARQRGRHDNVCIWLGQTEHDASLLDAQGRFVRAADHAQTIRQLAGVGALHYKPHPLAKGFAAAERRTLEAIVGRSVPLCETETYELLTSEDDVSFVAVSSGALQEAAWFGRPTYALLQPLCVPRFEPGQPGHLQIASHVFLSEPLWAALTGAAPRVQPLLLPPRPNRLRELHNTWWGYASASVKRSEHARQAWSLSGGAAQQQAIGRLETELTQARMEVAALRQQLAGDGRIDALRREVDALKAALQATA